MGKKDFVSVEDYTGVKKAEQKVEWEYNKKTMESYKKNKLEAPETLDYQEREFLSKVKTDKKPIEKEITRIFRLKAPDHNSNNDSKTSSSSRELKEWLVWYENWYGVTWEGKKIAPVTDHVEGLYYDQELETIVERHEIVGYKRSGQKEVYYIPFSKENLDKIIEDANKNSYKETIQFVVKVPNSRTAGYTYDQFCNYSFDECVDAMRTNHGPEQYERQKKEEAKKLQQIQKQQRQYS